MIIAVTGTPGTGKSRLSGILAKRIGAKVLNITELVNSEGLYSEIDRKRDTKVVDVSELKKRVHERVREFGKEDIILDGLMSHYLGADRIIVLRANPKLLKKRLEKRGYSREKVMENLEAEVMGVCLHEAVDCSGNILEMEYKNDSAVDNIVGWLGKGGMRVSDTDWTSEFYDMLSDLKKKSE